MAKKEAEVEASEEGEAKRDSRHIVVVDPDTGEEMRRVDFIHRHFRDPDSPMYGDRGAIAKRLSEITGKKVPYQVVFAATKSPEDKEIANQRREAKAAEAAAAEAEVEE